MKYMDIMNKKGITMVALVVTVVVLLILVTIVITFSIGEHGAVTEAIDAKKNSDLVAIREKIQETFILKEQQLKITGEEILDSHIREIFLKYGTIIESGGKAIGVTTEKGEVLLKEVWRRGAIRLAAK